MSAARERDPALRVACALDCGAPRGKKCTTATGNELRGSHASRRRAAFRLVRKPHHVGSVCTHADILAVTQGAPSWQEIMRDTWDLTAARWSGATPRTAKAWRVAVACALLERVDERRAELTVVDVLRSFPTPFGVLMSQHGVIASHVSPLGLKTRRERAIRLASEYALYEPGKLGLGDTYEAQSIRLVVDGDTSFQPTDKILAAVRARMLASKA